MTDKVKLLPCPFCGSDAVMMRDDGSCYKVKCSEAWCFAERACWRQTERAAVKDWNTRPTLVTGQLEGEGGICPKCNGTHLGSPGDCNGPPTPSQPHPHAKDMIA